VAGYAFENTHSIVSSGLRRWQGPDCLGFDGRSRVRVRSKKVILFAFSEAQVRHQVEIQTFRLYKIKAIQSKKLVS
jgi:hypothetical protein